MLLFAVALSHADSPPPPIVNGDTTSDYPQVVVLYSQNSRGEGSAFCSGTLIAEKFVLTAAHCTDAFTEMEQDYGLDQHYVMVGDSLYTNNGIDDYAGVKTWHAHDNWDGENSFYDIAVVELNQKITSIDPMPVNKDNLRDSMIGDDYRYVGWGVTSDYASDSGKKRTADLPLYDYDTTLLYAYDPVDDQNVCYGDSGGAGLEIIAEGQYELAAVNGFVYAIAGGSKPCSAGATGGARVDKFISFIEDYTPVQSWEEMYGGDTDTDTDSDTDTDTDSDTDTDTDADSDADTDTEQNDQPFDDASRPDDVGQDYGTVDLGVGFCGVVEPSGLAGLMVAAALARRRARRA